MNKDEFRKFSELWNGALSFYSKEASAAAITIAFQALQRYGLKQISMALSRHLQDSERGWAPKPSDVIRNIDGGPSIQAVKALTKADSTAARIGKYESVCFDDPLIHVVIKDMGGWAEFCGVLERERPFRNKEFERRYIAIAGNEHGQHRTHLRGLTELYNSRGGHGEFVKAPVLIGDKAKAEQVYLTGSNEKNSLARLDLDKVKKLAIAHNE
jgi:hypothetical protein